MSAMIDKRSHVEAILLSERAHLVRLCARITGAADAADDLAQEAMVIAWQNAGQLRDPARCRQWLHGIARNLCLHWLRDKKRQQLRLATQDNEDVRDAIDGSPRHFDLEIELDRQELADLLDRALALLPPLTRMVLIERYIHGSPQAEVARRLGLSEGAVEARVQRGKLTLRRVLTTELRDEATTYGLVSPEDKWQQTRIWCPCCGKQRLHGYFASGSSRSLVVRCFSCWANFGADTPGLFDGIQGYRAALSRLAKWYHPFFQTGLTQGCVACLRCGQPASLCLAPGPGMPEAFTGLPPATPGTYGFWTHCAKCNSWAFQSDLAAFAFSTPAVQEFWRNHPRMIILPERPIETGDGPGLLIAFQDLTGPARIELIFARPTLTFIGAHDTHD